jgi:putative ABC transport system ATP-binding protein
MNTQHIAERKEVKYIIEAKNLVRTFTSGGVSTSVLKGVDFMVKEGEFVAIMGRSGAGKSTLMYQLSLLDEPTSGSLKLVGNEVLHLPEGEKTHLRLMELGYVFQEHALVPELTAEENISVPLLMRGLTLVEAKKKADQILARVNLSHRLKNLPSQLSGGEQQRVSVARAIVHEPKILFADEPTANLDSESGDTVMKLFRELNDAGQTIIMVTHEEEYGKQADRIVRLADGRIVE